MCVWNTNQIIPRWVRLEGIPPLIKFKVMYYVVKTYEYALPLVVEQFDNLIDALDYANVLNRKRPDRYLVLKPLIKEDEDE